MADQALAGGDDGLAGFHGQAEPLEDRCVTLGTRPEQLTSQIAALLETLLTR